MAIDRRNVGLVLLRVAIGVFFVAEAASKVRWFVDSSALARQLAGWLAAAPPDSTSRWYLEHVCIPGQVVFARLVPIGEVACGLAMIVGFWTPIFASLAFLLALNFHIASGVIAHWSFLTNGYGLPVLGSTLALALGGVRLPWSIRN